MTHPFHPLSGRDFELVAHRQNWGEDRVHLHDENGQLFSLPAGWIDVAAADLFVVVAACTLTWLTIEDSQRAVGCDLRVPGFW